MADDSRKNDSKDPIKSGGPSEPTPSTPTTPAIDPTTAAMLKLTQALDRPRLGALSGPTPDLDKTIPGGKYRDGDRWVNADGEEINEDGSLKYPGKQAKDAYGRVTTVR